jgi:hypothetical protein
MHAEKLESEMDFPLLDTNDLSSFSKRTATKNMSKAIYSEEQTKIFQTNTSKIEDYSKINLVSQKKRDDDSCRFDTLNSLLKTNQDKFFKELSISSSKSKFEDAYEFKGNTTRLNKAFIDSSSTTTKETKSQKGSSMMESDKRG